MADSTAQQLRYAALGLKAHSSTLAHRRTGEKVRRAARRLEAGAVQLYTEEGWALIRSAANDLSGTGMMNDEVALRLYRVADSLEVKNENVARFNAARAYLVVKNLPQREWVSA